MKRPRLVVALLALLVVVPGSAGAQSPAEIEQARRTFAEGEEAEARGDCATAIARYEAVVEVKETAAVRLRIGRCNERLGRLLAAEGDYRRARDLARDDPRALEVATEVADALAPRIPRVEVVLAEDDQDATVTLDGAAVRPGESTPVDPGAHVIAAGAPGKERFEVSFDLAEGEARTVEVDLRAKAPAPPPAPPPPPPVEEGGAFPWLPVTLYGIGGVALGVAVPLLATSVSDDADLDAQCFDEAGRPSEDRDPCLHVDGGTFSATERALFEDERSSVNTRQGVGWALAGVGLAAAGVATVLLVAGDDEPGETGLRIESIDPVASGDEAGLWVAGAF